MNSKLLSDEEMVKAVYPDAEYTTFADGAIAIVLRRYSDEYLGWGQITASHDYFAAIKKAWADAKSKLPATEPKLPETFERWYKDDHKRLTQEKLRQDKENFSNAEREVYIFSRAAWNAGER